MCYEASDVCSEASYLNMCSEVLDMCSGASELFWVI